MKIRLLPLVQEDLSAILRSLEYFQKMHGFLKRNEIIYNGQQKESEICWEPSKSSATINTLKEEDVLLFQMASGIDTLSGTSDQLARLDCSSSIAFCPEISSLGLGRNSRIFSGKEGNESSGFKTWRHEKLAQEINLSPPRTGVNTKVSFLSTTHFVFSETYI